MLMINFNVQIAALTTLNWDLKKEIERLESIYRPDHPEIEKQKQEMRNTEIAIDTLLKANLDIESVERELIDMITFFKLQNPYPESVFTEPSKDERLQVNKILKENEIVQDKFFGSQPRIVWNNLCDKIINEIEAKYGDKK